MIIECPLILGGVSVSSGDSTITFGRGNNNKNIKINTQCIPELRWVLNSGFRSMK